MILLTRQFILPLLLLGFFQLHLQPIEGNHVIFENIGQMAGALSYIHCKLTLNLSSIHLQHQKYVTALQQLQNILVRHTQEDFVADKSTNTTFRWHIKFQELAEQKHNLHLQIVDEFITEAKDISNQLLAIRSLLPVVPSSSPSPSSSTLDNFRFTRSASPGNSSWSGPKAKVRLPRIFNFLNLPMGIFGTFMGLYNKAQIDNLRSQLLGTISAHNRLVEVVHGQEQYLQLIDNNLAQVTHSLNLLITIDPALTSTRLSRIETQIKERINIAVHVIQQAQHRRLAIDLLSHQQLQLLFARLQ
jgi:hypothetical protein